MKKNSKKKIKKNKKRGAWFLRLINLILIAFILLFVYGISKYYFFNERLVVVPDVVLLDPVEAKKVLEKSGLSYIEISARNVEVPKDIIYNQEPKKGELVRVKRAIKLYVNSENVNTIPNLVGMNVEDLGSFLSKNPKIKINRIDYRKSNDSQNIILATSPKSGSVMKIDEGISLLISSKESYDINKMVSVVDYDISKARRILRKKGYKNVVIKEIETTEEKEGVVIKQEPERGTAINKNDKVIIYVATKLISNKNVQDKKEELIKLESLFNGIGEGN